MNILYVFILSTVFYSYLFLVNDINKFANSNILQIKKSKERYYFVHGLLMRSIAYFKQYGANKYFFNFSALNNDFKVFVEYLTENFDEYKEIKIDGKIFCLDKKLYATFGATLKQEKEKNYQISLVDYYI